MSQSLGRKLRRHVLDDMTRVERQKDTKRREYALRIEKGRTNLMSRWEAMKEKYVPKWAQWCSVNLPPKWYIYIFNELLNYFPRKYKDWTRKFFPFARLVEEYHAAMRLQKGKQAEKIKNQVERWEIVFGLMHLPLNLIIAILSLVFLWPFNFFRKRMATLGLKIKIHCPEQYLMRQKITFWGKMVDETEIAI